MKERLTNDTFLGILVAALSILTAFAAYQVSLAEANADEIDTFAVKTLTESNTEFLRANQDMMLDFEAFDNYIILGAGNEETADYYLGTFSPALLAGMDRENGPFDDPYFDEIFFDADLLYEDALALFDEGQAAGAVADQLQAILLVLAVGLSMAAYASILEKKHTAALVFIVIALIALLFGVFRLVVILLG